MLNKSLINFGIKLSTDAHKMQISIINLNIQQHHSYATISIFAFTVVAAAAHNDYLGATHKCAERT